MAKSCVNFTFVTSLYAFSPRMVKIWINFIGTVLVPCSARSTTARFACLGCAAFGAPNLYFIARRSYRRGEHLQIQVGKHVWSAQRQRTHRIAQKKQNLNAVHICLLLHASEPSVHVWSKFGCSPIVHCPNHVPPGPQQLRSPVSVVPHIGHRGCDALVTGVLIVCINIWVIMEDEAHNGNADSPPSTHLHLQFCTDHELSTRQDGGNTMRRSNFLS